MSRLAGFPLFESCPKRHRISPCVTPCLNTCISYIPGICESCIDLGSDPTRGVEICFFHNTGRQHSNPSLSPNRLAFSRHLDVLFNEELVKTVTHLVRTGHKVADTYLVNMHLYVYNTDHRVATVFGCYRPTIFHQYNQPPTVCDERKHPGRIARYELSTTASAGGTPPQLSAALRSSEGPLKSAAKTLAPSTR